MVSGNLKLYTNGGKKMNGKVFFAAAVFCIGTAVFAAPPRHHRHHKHNEGLALANGIVDLVLKVVAPQPTVVVAPPPAVVAPAPAVVTPAPAPVVVTPAPVVAPAPVVVAPAPVVVAPPPPPVYYHRPAPAPRPPHRAPNHRGGRGHR